jgi:beta-glucosidase
MTNLPVLSMKTSQKFLFLWLSILIPFSLQAQKSKTPESNTFIENLIQKMTLEEKVGQMTEITLDVVSKRDASGNLLEPQTIDPERLKEAILKYKVGSILNVGAHGFSREEWYSIISSIQNLSLQDTRLKIPVIYGIDAIHGVTYTNGATLFPQEIGMAATFNPDLIYKAGEISAYETRASYIPWNFSPVLDLGMNPLWPRIYETFGEDPYLAKTMGSSIIHGYQGKGTILDKYHVASCMKHYIGYSYPKSGKDRTPAWMPERYLREYFLPTFQSAMAAGSRTLMVNSGEINGIPVHASKFLLTKLLKEELGFSGLVVSDWEDIKGLVYRHRIASNFKIAGEMAVNAGIDMSMVPYDYSFATNLIQSVKEGKVSIIRINDAVRRILRVKYELDLWKNPIGNPKDFPDFGSSEHIQAALQTAEESLILLKNKNNILPLSPSAKILVTGPTASTLRTLDGGWSYTWQGERTDEFAKGKNTILSAIQNIGGSQILYAKGSDFDHLADIDSALAKAQRSDIIVLCLGELSYTETPGNINDLRLPDAQLELARKLEATGKPIVLVLTEGRPRIFHDIESGTSAILLGLFPGNEGGDAIAKVLFGEVSPSGKLPITYPKYDNSLLNYNHKVSEELQAKFFAGYDPEFEFGYGLTYSQFTYSDLKLKDTVLGPTHPLRISITLTNSGNREAKEVVELYTQNLFSSISPDSKRLRKFKKLGLKPGESREVSFILDKSDLNFIGIDNKPTLESGNFRLMVGDKTATFTYKGGLSSPVVLDRF